MQDNKPVINIEDEWEVHPFMAQVQENIKEMYNSPEQRQARAANAIYRANSVDVWRNGDLCRVLIKDLRIVDVEFVHARYQTTVMVQLEDGSMHDAFSYYADELNFCRSELLGRTLEQASKLRFNKDVAYLRS